MRSIPENYASLKASAVVYDKDDFENTLRMCLYRLMCTALEEFSDTSVQNIARVFTTSEVAVKELCKMVAPHKDEQFSAFSFDEATYSQVATQDDAIADSDFNIAMGEVMESRPDAYVLYDLIVNQPDDFIQWCQARSESSIRNRGKCVIPNAYMKEYLSEISGWSRHRFDTAMSVLREKTKEVIAI